MRNTGLSVVAVCLLGVGCGPPSANGNGAFDLSFEQITLHRGDVVRFVALALNTSDPSAVSMKFPPGGVLRPGPDASQGTFGADSPTTAISVVDVETDPHAAPGTYSLVLDSPRGQATVKFTLTGAAAALRRGDLQPRTLADGFAVARDGTLVSLSPILPGTLVSGLRGVQTLDGHQEGGYAIDTEGRVFSFGGSPGAFEVGPQLPAMGRMVAVSVDHMGGGDRAPTLFLHDDGTVDQLGAVTDAGTPFTAVPGATDVVQVSTPYALQSNGDVLEFDLATGTFGRVEMASDAIEVSGGLAWFVRDDGLVMALPRATQTRGLPPIPRALRVRDVGQARHLETNMTFEVRQSQSGPTTNSYMHAFALQANGTIRDHSYKHLVSGAINSPVITETVTAPADRLVGSLNRFVSIAIGGESVYALSTVGKAYSIGDSASEIGPLPTLRLPGEPFFWIELDLTTLPVPLSPGGSTAYTVLIHRSPRFTVPLTMHATASPAGISVPDVVVPEGSSSATVTLLAAAGQPLSGGIVQLEATGGDIVQHLNLRIPGSAIGHRTAAVGWETAYAALADGGVVAWGLNREGGLGNGLRDGASAFHPPELVSVVADVVEVAASRHALALTRQGEVYGWGYNLQLEAGQPSGRNVLTPLKVAGLPVVNAIATAEGRSWARDEDGYLWQWGTGSATPTKLTTLGPVLRLSFNGEALTANGMLILESQVSSAPPHQLITCPGGKWPLRPLALTRMGPLVHDVLGWDGSITRISRPLNQGVVCNFGDSRWMRWVDAGGEVTPEGNVSISAGPTNTSPLPLVGVTGVVSMAYDAGKNVGLLVRSDGALLGFGSNNFFLLDGLLGGTGPAELGVTGVAQP